MLPLYAGGSERAALVWSLRTGPSAAAFPELGKQEDWWRVRVAAMALGGAAWELDALPEPERTFWYYRGLLAASAEHEAWDEDKLDKSLE